MLVFRYMIDSNTRPVLIFVLIILISAGTAFAQAPQVIAKGNPIVLQLDPSGYLYITAGTVATIIPDASDPNPTITVSPQSFDCTTRGPQNVTVTATDLQPPVTFNGPVGIVRDAAGNFYITDAGNHKIRKIDAAGNITDYAGSGTVGISNGVGTAATFDTPEGIAIDAAGNLYITDSKALLVRKISPAGVVTTLAGTAYSTANDKGIGPGVSFDGPYGIAVNAQGMVYVADAFGNQIRQITPIGDVSTVAGSETAGYADGEGNVAAFNLPSGIAIDALGNLIVADTYNNRIRKITPAGVVSTIAGNGAASAINGQGTSATFNLPNNLTVYGGNIYVADTKNNLVRKISPTAVVTTLAGTGVAGATDGPAASASFNSPLGLTFDTGGNLYVVDAGNNEVREITPAGVVNTFAGSGGAGDENGNVFAPRNLPVITVVVPVIVETTLKITTVYPDVTLLACVTAMPDFATSNPPQVDDNCNQNLPVHQVPAPGSVLSGNSIIPVDIIVEDATGKYDTATFKVYTPIFATPPTIAISPSVSTPVCAGTPVTFVATTTNTGSSTFQWQVNGVNSSTDSLFTSTFNDGDIVICNIVSGLCSAAAASAPYTVSVSPAPGISFSGNPSIKFGGSVQLSPIITGDIQSYSWSPTTGLSNPAIATPIASPVQTTTYRLTVTSATGCDSSAAVTVNVIKNVIIPNAFTPNGDGINDNWDIVGLVLYPGCTVSVYNRYGGLVYHSTNYARAWDGSYNKSPLPVGTYYYIIDLKNGAGNIAGPVTIIK
jgi:gliding motility-associated-like protein